MEDRLPRETAHGYTARTLLVEDHPLESEWHNCTKNKTRSSSVCLPMPCFLVSLATRRRYELFCNECGNTITSDYRILPRCHMTAVVASTPSETSSMTNLTCFPMASLSRLKKRPKL